MITSKLIAALVVGIITLQIATAQDTFNIYKPVFWNADITLGTKNQGIYGDAMLRLYRNEKFVALGVRGFNYVPDDLPHDYHGGLETFTTLGSEGALNSNTLCLIGVGNLFLLHIEP